MKLGMRIDTVELYILMLFYVTFGLESMSQGCEKQKLLGWLSQRFQQIWLEVKMMLRHAGLIEAHTHFISSNQLSKETVDG